VTAGDWLSLAQGALTTVTLSIVAIAIGLPLGLALALVRWRGVRLASPCIAVLVSLLRASPGVTLGLLIFFAIALQCVSTIAIVRRETGGWKWPAIQFAGFFILAYALSFAAVRLFA